MSVIHNDLLLSSDEGGYNIAKSLRFRSSASAYLNRSFSGSGTSTQKKTFSWWMKRGKISVDDMRLFSGYDGSSAQDFYIRFTGGDVLNIHFGGTTGNDLTTTQVFRDPSSWYHFVIAFDTTQATASNRCKVYVNGTQITSFGTANYIPQNEAIQFGITNQNVIYANRTGSGSFVDGYQAETNFIDGQQLTPSDFGEYNADTGVWQPIAYTGTYGTNGFYLPFTDVATTSGSNAGLGKDFSGNGNYWTTNNISVTSGATYDSMKDVPTLTDTDTANYCTLNPLYAALPNATITNGNLQINSSVSSDNRVHGTIAVTSGKWYYETTMTGYSGTPYYYVGWAKAYNPTSSTYSNLNYTCYEWGSDGMRFSTLNGSSSNVSGTTFTTGDVIGIAFDADAGTITCYKNGTSLGVYFSGITVDAPFRPSVYTNSASAAINFGQRPFAYTPPTGYVALNTYNLE